MYEPSPRYLTAGGGEIDMDRYPVKVAAPGPLRGFVGSVVALYPAANPPSADVVLDDGRADNEGGTLPPAHAKNFPLTELALA